jgi:SAM-dependent methyltransferase
MNTIKEFIKGIPFVQQAFKLIVGYKLKNKSPEAVFSDIYVNNTWKDKNSISGTGSNLSETEVIRQELPKLFRQLNIESVLDIPCGDFYWMKTIDLNGVNYTGADIVKPLIEKNNLEYKGPNKEFVYLNLLQDELPKVDLIICRDCLVHFAFSDAITALKNIARSKSTYLLTTTFTDRGVNRDILTGDWRTLNLSLPPFNLPSPSTAIKESCNESNGKYKDKTLALWKIEDILKVLEKHHD